MNGTRLFGTPLGSSPISADGCAPIGLKYLSAIPLMQPSLWTPGVTSFPKRAYAFTESLRMSSQICLVLPYGDVAG